MSKCANLSELGEFGLIESLKSPLSSTLRPQTLGIGDDCAVFDLAANARCLATTDILLEGVHFRREFCSAYDLGWKSLAVSLSDIAAMGGKPQTALVGLQVADVDAEYLAEVYRGIADLARRFAVEVVGGDTVKSQQFGVCSTVFGVCFQAPRLRSLARAGQHLFLSGEVGAAAAALEFLRRGNSAKECEPTRALAAYRRPNPRIVLGQQLSAGLADAMIDLSDGLLQDAGHIATASSVDLIIDLAQIPCWSEQDKKPSPSELLRALTGGDDYQLIFTAAPSCELEICSLADNEAPWERPKRIGSVIEGKGEVWLRSENGNLMPARQWVLEQGGANSLGYDHFKG